MKTTKKQPKLPLWQVLLRGVGGMLMVYTAGVLVLTALVLHGTIQSVYSTMSITGLSAICGLLCGFVCAKRIDCSPVLSALLAAACFDLALLAIGFCWNGVHLTGEGGAILAYGLAGGLVAGGLELWKIKRARRRKFSAHL